MNKAGYCEKWTILGADRRGMFADGEHRHEATKRHWRARGKIIYWFCLFISKKSRNFAADLGNM